MRCVCGGGGVGRGEVHTIVFLKTQLFNKAMAVKTKIVKTQSEYLLLYSKYTKNTCHSKDLAMTHYESENTPG